MYFHFPFDFWERVGGVDLVLMEIFSFVWADHPSHNWRIFDCPSGYKKKKLFYFSTSVVIFLLFFGSSAALNLAHQTLGRIWPVLYSLTKQHSRTTVIFWMLDCSTCRIVPRSPCKIRKQVYLFLLTSGPEAHSLVIVY